MFSVLILLKLVLISFSAKQVTSSDLESRILYGETAKIEDYPFYAGLDNCGAAIISNTWILTAAHCVDNVQPSRKNYVWVGGETFANSIKVPYNKVIIHEEYQKMEGLPVHDVALIKLSKPLQFSKKVQAIKLPSRPTSNSRVVFVGRGKDETGKISKHLQKVDLVRLTTEQCISLVPQQYHSYVRQNIKLFEKMNICAKRESDKPSICHGDSGSPLFSGNTLIGLASYIGKQCSQVRLGFYVNVASYMPWIKAATGL
ncbi:chymotrypsin-1-like [Vanessa atalanta]|uniref:chymotrypsin-1-like n=1 Tax=Vanessa atalanta TaxID=42275 RepID=UPI001FCD4917|nr:chymotrypsin-1-like [Vanessa atalanta]